jgi:hypothetical protein
MKIVKYNNNNNRLCLTSNSNSYKYEQKLQKHHKLFKPQFDNISCELNFFFIGSYWSTRMLCI